MSDQQDSAKVQRNAPDVKRRQLNVAVLAALAGGLGMAGNAQAFPRAANLLFNAASRLLAPYGVTVDGDVSHGHDRLSFEIAARPSIEYTQVVGTRNRRGDIEPSWMTSVFGDDASATHFHPGEIVPCVRTTIEGHTLATHELFDSDQRGITPSFVVESEMLDGGHIGTVTATHFHDGAIVPCIKTTIEGHSRATHELFDADDGDIIPCVKVASEMLDGGVLGDVEVAIDADLTSFRVVIEGGNAYRLVRGELVLEAQ